MASLEDVTKELKQLNADSLSAGDVVKYVNAAGEEREAVFMQILESLNAQGKTMVQLQTDNATFAIEDQQLLVEENDTLEGILKDLNKSITGLVQFLQFDQKQESREESTETGGTGKPRKEGGGLKGAFSSGLEKGETEQLGLMKTIEGIAEDLGMWTGKTLKVFRLLKSGIGTMFTSLIGLVGKVVATIIQTVIPAISAAMSSLMAMMAPMVAAIAPLIAPIALIAAGITALVMGVMKFVEDFKGQEGSLFDKIFAGIMGFVDGFMQILTIPLDWIKDLMSGILGFFGFDGAAQLLDSFSFTDLFDQLTDTIVEFVLGLKDSLIEGIKSFLPDSLLSFFGLNDDKEESKAEEPEEPAKPEPMRERVMTKDGFKDLTREEIEQGKKDGTIKRTLANNALEDLKQRERATGLKEKDDYFKTERVATEGRIDGTAVLSGRTGKADSSAISVSASGEVSNEDIAMEGVKKEDVQKYVDRGMSPRAAIAQANMDKTFEEKKAPTPTKIPRAERVETEGRVDGTAVLAGTPRKQTAGTVVTALGKDPAVRNTARQIMVEQGIPAEVATTITNEGPDIIAGATKEGGILGSIGSSISNFFGGGETAAQGDMLQQAQDRLSSKKAEGGANTANIVTTTNSTNASVVNNTTVSQGMPTSQNNTTRSHYRGRRI